jgi:hypothetical protein
LTPGNVTQVKKLEMNYANYDASIVQAYGVQLTGWPLDGGVVSPAHITNTVDMRKLRNMLKSGECRWKKLTESEVQAHADEMEARRANGEVIGKQRKRRSDAGVKRKRVDGGNDKENERPRSKKQKVVRRKKATAKKAMAKKSQAHTSREYISDSDEEDHSPTEDDETD